MRTSHPIFLGAALFLTTFAAHAQLSSSGDTAPPGTVPISSLVATVARKTHRKFVLDPRVRANVSLVGEDPSSVTYDELLTILDTYGFTAVTIGDYVEVIPNAGARAQPLPLISADEKRPADEYVTAVFHVKSLPAGWLVPILRPMVPQQGHLAAMPCSNDLVMSDRFANVRRIEAIIKAMDTGTPIKTPSCIVPMPHPWMPGSPPTRQPH
jgi:general secretion pathway protein D